MGIWFWDMDPHAMDDIGASAPPNEEEGGWFASTDPFFQIFGPGRSVRSEDRVQGARTVDLLYMSGSSISGQALISEGGDLVRVRDMEVDDFSHLGVAANGMLRVLESYGRLGYDVFTVEGIMGVDAGGSAPTVRSALEEWGLREVQDRTRSIMVRGISRSGIMDRSDIMAAMLVSQSLVAGHFVPHPVSVLLLNLSLSDRWEALARLGSGRYHKIPPGRLGEVRNRISRRMDRLVRSIMDGDMPEGTDITDLLTQERGSLPENRDLMRELDLESGPLDQPSPVWSIRPILRRFPSMDLPPCPRDPSFAGLLTLIGRMSRSGRVHPEVVERRDDVEVLHRRGLVSIDAWGGYHVLREHRRKGPGRDQRDVTKGVVLRAFLLSIALSLGTFTMRDVMALSPGLGPSGRVRIMLTEMCRTHLDRSLMTDPSFEVVYSVKDIDHDHIRDVSERLISEGPLVVLSPRDRLSRVISRDFSGPLGRSRGYLVLRGVHPAAVLGLRRTTRAPASAGLERPGTHRLIMTSVRRDRTVRAESILRDIRRHMFGLGYSLGTESDLEKERSLYEPG
jgi:hypothetical protein